MSILALIFTTILVFGDCNISNSRKGEMCPVTPDHIFQFKSYYDCLKGGAGSSAVRKRDANSNSRHKHCLLKTQEAGDTKTPLTFMFSPAALVRMSPTQRQQEIQKFFQQNRQPMVNDVAEDMFREDFKHLNKKAQPPVWDADLSQTKRDKLSERAAQRRSSLNFLQNTHKQLRQKANGNNQQAKALLKNFEARYQNYIRAAGKRGGSWVQIKEPKVYRYRTGWVDIANDAWKDIPEDLTYERPDGKRVSFKNPYTKVAQQQVDKMEKGLTRGLDWHDMTFASDSDRQRLQKVVKGRGAQYRSQVETRFGQRIGKLGHSRNVRVRRGAGGSLRAVRMAGAWITMAALSAVGLYMSQVEDCKQAFPFYPTRYEKPNVNGLGPQSKCKPVFPRAGKEAPEIEIFASLDYATIHELLNKDQSAASPCAYYQRAYRQMFCAKGPSVEGSDDATF